MQKSYDDVRNSYQPSQALDVALMRLAFVKDVLANPSTTSGGQGKNPQTSSVLIKTDISISVSVVLMVAIGKTILSTIFTTSRTYVINIMEMMELLMYILITPIYQSWIIMVVLCLFLQKKTTPNGRNTSGSRIVLVLLKQNSLIGMAVINSHIEKDQTHNRFIPTRILKK